eukprot:COSAG01_NODE_180_length_22910_cov_19.255710_7_plen_163_part_00
MHVIFGSYHEIPSQGFALIATGQIESDGGGGGVLELSPAATAALVAGMAGVAFLLYVCLIQPTLGAKLLLRVRACVATISGGRLGGGGAGSLPPGWEAIVDPASGATYYLNSKTGETTWDPPAPEPPPTAAAMPYVAPARGGGYGGGAGPRPMPACAKRFHL